MSRNTAYRLEKGDPGIAMGQILRYLDAIVPGKTLLELLELAPLANLLPVNTAMVWRQRAAKGSRAASGGPSCSAVWVTARAVGPGSAAGPASGSS